MGKALLNYSIAVLTRTLSLFLLALALWYFLKAWRHTFQEVLFYMGAVPIVLITLGRFGDFAGRGTPTSQLSRSVMKLSPTQRAVQDERDRNAKWRSEWPWVIAGLLLWGGSYCIDVYM